MLSGHTHGGQVGLVSLGLGLDCALGDALARPRPISPEASSRLYVHRGTGFYGFPLRIGVPGEASLIEVVVERAAA